jgi:A/G-specific adenine glycosylase
MLCTSEGQVLLERRAPVGIWGGLWSFPECPADVDDISAWCRDHLKLEVDDIQTWNRVRHTFSHFHLDLTPLQITVKNPTTAVMEADRFVWYNTRQPDERGLAAPVQRLLSLLAAQIN